MTLDTSAVLALLNRKDQDHQRIKEAIFSANTGYRIPIGILAEIAYLIETRFGTKMLDLFISDLLDGIFTLEFEQQDLIRAQILVNRYANLPLGLSDALVIACAERNGGLVISLDRHFWVVAGENTITVRP